MRSVTLACALLALAVLPSETAAQSPAGAEPGRFEVGAAGGWMSGYRLGSSRGTLASPSGPETLFDAEARIEGGPTGSVHVAWRVWRTWSVEGRAEIARLHLASRVTSDVDPALNGTVDMPFRQLAVHAGLIVPVTRWASREGRLVPFLTGGGGHLQQADEEGVRLETGRLGFAGGGVRLMMGELREDRFFKGLGLRADARLVLRTGGIDVERHVRTSLTLAAGAFVRF